MREKLMMFKKREGTNEHTYMFGLSSESTHLNILPSLYKRTDILN